MNPDLGWPYLAWSRYFSFRNALAARSVAGYEVNLLDLDSTYLFTTSDTLKEEWERASTSLIVCECNHLVVASR